jgi:Tol biopolymer transport system component
VNVPLFTHGGARLLFDADKFYSVLADGSAGAVELAPTPVSRARVSPNDTLVVFRDDQSQLCARAVDGSTEKLVLAPEVSSGASFEITADGTRVVFVGDGALSVVPIDGSAAPWRSPARARLLRVAGTAAADGEWTIFVDALGSCGVSVRRQVYSVRLDGSEAPHLLSNFTGFGFQASALAPDGQTVVYSGQHVCGSSSTRLYSVPIDGSAAAIQLGSTSTGSISELEISPDGTRVVYGAAPTSGVYELFSVPIDGSASETRLNPALGPGMDVGGIFDGAFMPHSFKISPDGARVVYVADQRFDEVVELFHVPIAGGTSTELTGGMVAGGDVSAFELGPFSHGVTFLADKLIDGVDELFAVPFTGGAPFHLNAALVPGGDVVDFAHSADDQYIVYRADRTTDEVFELYRVPVTGGFNRRLNGALVSGGDVTSYAIAADSSRVAYLADEDTDDVRELYSVPLPGNQPSVRLNGPLPLGPVTGDVSDFEVAADAQAVVYLADADVEGVNELYRAPIGGGAVARISGDMGSGGGIVDWKLTSDGSRAVYVAEQDTDGLPELYSVEVVGNGTADKLSHALAPGNLGVQAFELSADGTRVIYRTQDASSADLFAASVDGNAVPVQLNLPGQSVASGFPPEHHITSDGEFVLYRTASALWRVRTDGSDSPVMLSAPMIARGLLYEGSDKESFQLSADGQWVAYLADARFDGRYELFLVAVDGLGSDAVPIRVNMPLAVGGDVTSFSISADGGRVLYGADQDVDERFELYAYVRGLAPTTPPGAPPKVRRDTLGRIKLNPPLAPGGDVESYVLAPDGSQVLFSAGPNNGHRLYLASTDGSTPRTVLGMEPRTPSFSPDGAHVVFQLEGQGLFSAPSDGSAAPVLLNSTGCEVESYVVSADGAWVAFRSKECGNNLTHYRLYARPIDASLPKVLLNGAMQSGGDVFQFGLSSDSNYAVYRADQDVESLGELYSSPLPALP